MAEAQTSIQYAREAPFLEDYRRRLLESAFKKADSPTPVARRGIADFDTREGAAFDFGARQMGIDPATDKVLHLYNLLCNNTIHLLQTLLDL